MWFVIGGFRSILWFSVFPGTLVVIIIMIDGTAGKTQLKAGYKVLEFARTIENRSNDLGLVVLFVKPKR